MPTCPWPPFGAASFSQSYTFDALGNVLEETYPRCVSPRCERYGPPRVVSYEFTEGSLTAIPGWVDPVSYHSNGLLSQIEHVNGMTDSWTKDPDSMQRPREIDFDGPTSMSLGNYSYDGVGNVKSIGSHLFAYDLVSRLTEADLQPLAKSQSYSFDSYGNMTSIVTTTGTVPESRPIGVSPATNRLTGAGYDASGNVTNLFTLSSLTYDPFNRVTHLTGTGVNRSFLYDTSDNRVAILDHQAGTEEWHLRGLHDKVVRSFELGPEGWSWKKDWVFRDGQLVGSTEPARWREYHLDHLGSPRLVTDPIGLKVAEYHPFPFGEMASANEPKLAGKEKRLFRYTGHERDENCETGGCSPEAQDDLDYMMARFYSPMVGRFLQSDPQLPSAAVTQPKLWNRFAYSSLNPLKYIDPDGKEGIGVLIDLDNKDYLEGRITQEELRERRTARAVGGAVGTAVSVIVIGAFYLGDLLLAPDAGQPEEFQPQPVPDTILPSDQPGVVNPNIYEQLELQLERNGEETIHKALNSAKDSLKKHQEKLPDLEHRSAVEKTIRNIKNQIATIEKFIADHNL